MKGGKPGGSWLWPLIIIGGLWAAWYWCENQPSRVRANLEQQLAEIDQERRGIYADRLRRAAEDRAFRIEIGHVDRETATLLLEGERLAREIDDQLLSALAERERRIEQRLSALKGE